tara:strand:+ start:6041 stop:6481 length:441 start_codon:yes stop_codon:yes gene_type:complete
MIESNLSLQKPLEDYIETYDKLTPRSVMLLEPLVDDGFVFQDPYHKAQGFLGLSSIIAARFALYEGSRYKMHDFMWGRRATTAYMFWSFSYDVHKKHITKRETTTHTIQGMSELVFSGGSKKILSQTDFWGAHEDFDVKAYKTKAA